MKAIRVKVNFTTGERAGGINPRDKNLRCSPLWQNLEAGVEIRAVLDGDVSRYAALEGVEILDGEAAIDAAEGCHNGWSMVVRAGDVIRRASAETESRRGSSDYRSAA